MKGSTIYIALIATGLSVMTLLALHLHAGEQSLRAHATGHISPASTDGPVTVRFADGDGSLCGLPDFDTYYALTLEVFAQGAAQVNVDDYQQKTFALFRTSTFFGDATPEQIEDHIKDIPGQLVQIIKDDPRVLENCENFSVALVGPP